MAYPRIKELRKDADMKQWQMAYLLNCTQQAYSDYETGRHEVPIGILIALAEYHKTNVDYILGLTNKITLEGNKGQRKSCSCPSNKRQLVTHIKPEPCKNKCVYCYWKDND